MRDDGAMTAMTRPRLPLQARLVAWVLLSAIVILGATLVVSQLVLRDRAADRVTQELQGEVAELRLLADEGLDPATGERFSDVRSLLRAPAEVDLAAMDTRATPGFAGKKKAGR